MPDTTQKLDDTNKGRIVVDTDVVSYIFRKDTRADYFRPYLEHRTLAISFMTVAELYYGARKNNWSQPKIIQLENTIKNYVVLPYDYLVCQEWARIRTTVESKGFPMSHSDLWIAACALRYDCALATNNGTHFANIAELTLISPGLAPAI